MLIIVLRHDLESFHFLFNSMNHAKAIAIAEMSSRARA